MWKTRIDLTGQQFGRLTVKEFANTKNNHAYWLCVCSCGKEKIIVGNDLRNGSSKSCGCLCRETYKKQIGSLCRNWKGGRIKHSGGYIYVMAKNHPRADKDGYVLEQMGSWFIHYMRSWD